MKSKLLEGEPLVVGDLDCVFTVTHYKYKPRSGPTIRSCWVCNPAHEHLKTAAHLLCFVCGRTYHNGVEETP